MYWMNFHCPNNTPSFQNEFYHSVCHMFLHLLMMNHWAMYLSYYKTSTGIDADASKGETSPGYFNSKLVYSYKCGTIFPWEFPEISLAYSHIFLKGPSRSVIYGKIFWPPHPHPHIASPASICHQNQLSFVFRFAFIQLFILRMQAIFVQICYVNVMSIT